MSNAIRRTCLECQFAEIDPGDPGVHTFSNGDPGYPPVPPCAFCTDPLAGRMAEEYEDILSEVNSSISRAVWRSTLEYKNYNPGEETCISFAMKHRIENDLREDSDFAQYCPMFKQRMMTCRHCNKEVPQAEFGICDACEKKYLEYEEEHQKSLDEVIWHEPYTVEQMDEIEEVLNKCG